MKVAHGLLKNQTEELFLKKNFHIATISQFVVFMHIYQQAFYKNNNFFYGCKPWKGQTST
jgi:hypothetical protein